MWRYVFYFVAGIMAVLLLVGRNNATTLTPTAAPDIHGSPWFNSAPLTLSKLKGKVVLVEFWTHGCYNCRNVEPYVKQWYNHYHNDGFTVVGVHTPEFDYEREAANVQGYIKSHDITYPVVMDNDFAIWRRYQNRYWPAMYLLDRQGRMRYLKIGEGGYAETEQQIKALLKENPAS
jgi:thiol-disulfide isomerase/thioredoxin